MLEESIKKGAQLSIHMQVSFTYRPMKESVFVLITTDADNTTIRIENFQEVTTVKESARNLVVFSFDLLTSDDFNISIDGHVINNGIFQLQWETANKSSSELITLADTRDHGFNFTTEDSVTYYFTVAATTFGEGPLLLTLSTRLQCIRYTSSNCNLYRRPWCTCSVWQYGGESETILIDAKKGKSHTHCVHISHLKLLLYTICAKCSPLKHFSNH